MLFAKDNCYNQPMITNIADNISSKDGHLTFAGQDTVELAKEYGTPLYLLDEDKIRENCRTYTAAFKKYFGEGSRPLYASKANSFKGIYRIMQEEGMGIDVVSPGEIYVAKAAGYNLSQAYFHGNCKTDADIAFAFDNGVGVFVADNQEEVIAVEAEAAKRGVKQRVMLRITPGIDPHTYEAISTGKVDSKFGSAVETGQADEIVALTLKQPHLELVGFHCHVGSQVFAEDVYERTVIVMIEFAADMKRKYGYELTELDLGGGFGVPYVDTDGRFDIDQKLSEIAKTLEDVCARLGIRKPLYHMEPGRSVVAAAGMTLYTVGSTKRIPGYKNYVAIDGGMTDNPRYALYGSKYTCFVASRIDEQKDLEVSIVGRCCESGDIIQRDVMVPATVQRGDIVAVCTTGAYNYAMASNYNKIPYPAMVLLKDGESKIAIKRQSYADLCMNDV